MEWKKTDSQPLLKILGLIILLGALPLALFLLQKQIFLLLRAEEKPAEIIIEVNSNLGPVEPFWQALAQGGEEKYPFANLQTEIASLGPQYIRIDHLYDYYQVVERQGEKLVFNWQALDLAVDQILATGARPFLSLSYMPPAIAQKGVITNPPQNWEDWRAVVQQTVQHFSGRQEKNIKDVVYEVWNEPDLFGNWQIGKGEKDYRFLYRLAVEGANLTLDVNPFQIGGPGVTAPYHNWLKEFINYVVTYQLRCDFYSWHRYSLSPQDFLTDINQIDDWLANNAYSLLPKYLTEWGSNSEISSFHDNRVDAAHLVAVARQLLQRVDLALVFEAKDGPDPAGKKFWGRWGLLTHESAGPIEKKPKYQALTFLNQMTGTRLKLEGENHWVTGWASQKGQSISLILANYDPQGNHFEKVPLVFRNLDNGHYQYQASFLSQPRANSIEKITVGFLSKEIPLPANEIVLVQLEKI